MIKIMSSMSPTRTIHGSGSSSPLRKEGMLSSEPRSPGIRLGTSQSSNPFTKIDPYLNQYLNLHPTKQNEHQVYFNSIIKSKKVKQYELYSKYLVHKSPLVSIPSPISTYQHKQPHQQYIHKKISPIIPAKQSLQIPISQSPKKIKLTPEITPITNKFNEKIDQVEPKIEKVPNNFMNCSIDILIILISRMVQSLITLNDKQVPSSISNPYSSNENAKKVLTRYHSRTPPSISTFTYLTRLSKFNNFNPATLLTTIYYIDLLSHNYQPFFTLNSWTVHRFLLVATMLAQKSMEDFFYTNDHYAKVGGVAINELNCLEIDFLNRVDWRLIPAKHLSNGKRSIKDCKSVLDLYYNQLILLMGKNTNSLFEDSNIIYTNEKSDVDEDDDESMDDINDDFYEHDKYNNQGFAIDGSSSPHLKRSYSRFNNK